MSTSSKSFSAKDIAVLVEGVMMACRTVSGMWDERKAKKAKETAEEDVKQTLTALQEQVSDLQKQVSFLVEENRREGQAAPGTEITPDRPTARLFTLSSEREDDDEEKEKSA